MRVVNEVLLVLHNALALAKANTDDGSTDSIIPEMLLVGISALDNDTSKYLSNNGVTPEALCERFNFDPNVLDNKFDSRNSATLISQTLDYVGGFFMDAVGIAMESEKTATIAPVHLLLACLNKSQSVFAAIHDIGGISYKDLQLNLAMHMDTFAQNLEDGCYDKLYNYNSDSNPYDDMYGEDAYIVTTEYQGFHQGFTELPIDPIHKKETDVYDEDDDFPYYDDTDDSEIYEQLGPEFMPQPVQQDKFALIRSYGRNITELAAQGKLNPVIGRDKEIEDVIRILSRKTKNAPCLIGEPGVGKTAVIEEIAQRIVSGKIANCLKKKTIFEVDVSSVVAGTKYRGEMEAKLNKIMTFAEQNPDVILFIDEIHMICGAGETENGSMDIANILKPKLGRGTIKLIGATTISEYAKSIERDGALDRRFSKVMIDEPSEEETIKILNGIREDFEKYHKVKITSEALVQAVKLSKRYITNKMLPDKAIDLIDDACSRAKFTKPKKRLGYVVVNASDISEVIAHSTGISIAKINEDSKERYLRLEDNLKKRVMGHEDAIHKISDAIIRSGAGLNDPKKPIASFLFSGPTGVGKTELAKALAEVMFDDREAIIRIDMSEYMSSMDVNKLIGTPVGYTGYKEGGLLTNAVSNKPYSIVLFDEIEKAHPDVFKLMLQVLDEGHLRDACGKMVNFKNTIIIMTSNLGGKRMISGKNRTIGFIESDTASNKDAALGDVKEAFSSEFINRLDDVIVFESLSNDAIRRIVETFMKDFCSRLVEQDISIKYTAKVLDYLANKGFSQEYGARPIKRLVESEIGTPISLMLIKQEIKSGDSIRVSVAKDVLKFDVQNKKNVVA